MSIKLSLTSITAERFSASSVLITQRRLQQSSEAHRPILIHTTFSFDQHEIRVQSEPPIFFEPVILPSSEFQAPASTPSTTRFLLNFTSLPEKNWQVPAY